MESPAGSVPQADVVVLRYLLTPLVMGRDPKGYKLTVLPLELVNHSGDACDYVTRTHKDALEACGSRHERGATRVKPGLVGAT